MFGPADFNTDGVVGGYSTGPFTTETNPNFAKPPDVFSSNKAFVQSHGFVGTKSNMVAAKGIFEPYNKMKGGMSKLSTHSGNNKSMDVQVPGPASGHREVGKYNAGEVISDTAHIKQFAGKRRSCRSKTNKMRSSRYRSRRGGIRKMKFNRRYMKRSRKIKTPYPKRKTHKYTKRLHRGGNQPFSNQSLSFGYGINVKPLSSSESALANPTPINAYSTCGKI